MQPFQVEGRKESHDPPWFFGNCASFQALGQPIQARFQESEERPKAFEDLGKQIQHYMKTVHAFKAKVCPSSAAGKRQAVVPTL